MQPTLELTPEERLLAATIKLAIRDAKAAKSDHTRNEAREFLWTVAPTVAKLAEVPAVTQTVQEYEAILLDRS